MNKLTFGQFKRLKEKQSENSYAYFFWKCAEKARLSALESPSREFKGWYRDELNGIQVYRYVLPLPG